MAQQIVTQKPTIYIHNVKRTIAGFETSTATTENAMKTTTEQNKNAETDETYDNPNAKRKQLSSET